MSERVSTTKKIMFAVVAVAAATFAISGTSSADVASSPTSNPSNGAQYSCVNSFPAGATFQLQASFPGSAVDPGETVSYGLVYGTGGVSFTGNWQLSVRLPDGSTAMGSSNGVTVPAGGPIASVAYTVPAGTPGSSTLSAWITNVTVTNTANSTTVACDALGAQSQVDLTTAPPPTTSTTSTTTTSTTSTTTTTVAPSTSDASATTGPATTGPATTGPATTAGAGSGGAQAPTTTQPNQLPSTGPWSGATTGSAIGGMMALLLGALAVLIARRDPTSV